MPCLSYDLITRLRLPYDRVCDECETPPGFGRLMRHPSLFLSHFGVSLWKVTFMYQDKTAWNSLIDLDMTAREMHVAPYQAQNVAVYTS